MSALPKILYHYCPVHSFKGIVESKSLWMSGLGTMSDFMEYKWLKRLALNRIEELASQKQWAMNVEELPEKTKQRNRLLVLDRQLRSVPAYDPFCVSFSSDGDVLSQWRAYTDDGKGFAIGFVANYLRGPEKETPEEVCYDLADHEFGYPQIKR